MQILAVITHRVLLHFQTSFTPYYVRSKFIFRSFATKLLGEYLCSVIKPLFITMLLNSPLPHHPPPHNLPTKFPYSYEDPTSNKNEKYKSLSQTRQIYSHPLQTLRLANPLKIVNKTSPASNQSKSSIFVCRPNKTRSRRQEGRVLDEIGQFALTNLGRQ